MSQRDVAFALELVARTMGERAEVMREDYGSAVTPGTLEDLASELVRMATMLNAAPVQSCEPTVDVWGEHNGCVAHPLGGWDCVAEV